jgi:outer membrane protein OmpA-like peptidoglycan-associated protein
MKISTSSHTNAMRPAVLVVLALGMAACAATPHGPPPDIVRLQVEQDRLHADARVATYGGDELANADAAVATLAVNARALPPRDYEQGVYLTGKLLQIAEASALAREAEQRGARLGLERDRLGARSSVAMTVGEPIGRDDRAPMQDDRERLFEMQRRLPNSESKVDARGLVVRLADFNFRGGEGGLTATGEQSLHSLARVLDDEPQATANIAAFGDRGIQRDRALTVREYLNAHGVERTRIDIRAASSGTPHGGSPGDVLIVVRE